MLFRKLLKNKKRVDESTFYSIGDIISNILNEKEKEEIKNIIKSAVVRFKTDKKILTEFEEKYFEKDNLITGKESEISTTQISTTQLDENQIMILKLIANEATSFNSKYIVFRKVKSKVQYSFEVENGQEAVGNINDEYSESIYNKLLQMSGQVISVDEYTNIKIEIEETEVGIDNENVLIKIIILSNNTNIQDDAFFKYNIPVLVEETEPEILNPNKTDLYDHEKTQIFNDDIEKSSNSKTSSPSVIKKNKRTKKTLNLNISLDGNPNLYRYQSF